MKPSLQLKLSQQLALTPQLQQSIRLLQLSTLELEQELENYLQENPLLEREEEEYAAPPHVDSGVSTVTATPESADDEASAPPALDSGESWQDDDSRYASSSGSFDEDDGNYQDVQAATTSLREHLLWQLGTMGLPNRDRMLVQCLIDALDDDAT